MRRHTRFCATQACAGARRGWPLGSSQLGGAIAGGVISYDTGEGQRVAVAVGMTSPIWPTAKVTAKVVILGRK